MMLIKRLISVSVAAALAIGMYSISIPSVSAAEQDDYSLPVPEFSEIEVIDGGIRFSWDEVENDQFPEGVLYCVFYRDYDGEWVHLITTAATQFVDTDVYEGEAFDYTIRCIDPFEEQFVSDYDHEGWNVAYYEAPSVKSVVSVTEDVASADEAEPYAEVDETYEESYAPAMRADTITWDGSAPAYRVYRQLMDSDRMNPEQITEVICESTNDRSFTYEYYGDDTVYAYKVCALDAYGDVASDCGVSPYYINGELYSTQNRWLYELLSAKIDDIAYADYEDLSYSELSKAAIEYGALKDAPSFVDGSSLKKQFAADTLVDLFGYTPHSLGNYYNTAGNSELMYTKSNESDYYAADTNNKNMNTACYYGWFEPDSKNMLHPRSDVNADEWDEMMSELSLYRTWNGKTVISFGDSGIQGKGNIVSQNGGDSDGYWKDVNRGDYENKRFPRYDSEQMEGPAEFIGEKYGMIHRDYSWSGSTMGVELEEYDDHYIFTNSAVYKSHIANQVRTAIEEGQTADLIIINGGDNDELCPSIEYDDIDGERLVYDWGYSSPEWFSEPFQRDFYSLFQDCFQNDDHMVLEDYTDEASFVDGTNKTFSLIEENYSSVPVIYVRSHQIDYGSLADQRLYQEEVLEIASDYGFYTVDLFNESDLDGCNKSMAANYCYDGYYDDGTVDDTGTHPNGLGYSKYYLPFIEDELSDFSDSLS